MASRASLQSKDDSSGEITVQFDNSNGGKYAMCSSCVWCTTWCVGLNLPVQPCLCYCAVKEFKSQHCTVDDRRIHYNSGWINKKEKTIPLDRVQDIGIESGCLQRYALWRRRAGGESHRDGERIGTRASGLTSAVRFGRSGCVRVHAACAASSRSSSRSVASTPQCAMHALHGNGRGRLLTWTVERPPRFVFFPVHRRLVRAATAARPRRSCSR